MASPATTIASIGDSGVLNASLPRTLSTVWIDRDLSWLDFNERVLAEALDEERRCWSGPSFSPSSLPIWTNSS